MARLAFFGGSFNPIHKGHKLLALDLIKRLNLDKVLFMPNSNPPHKDSLALDFKTRCLLIEKSIDKEHKLSLSTIESDPSFKHYTYNTLSELTKIYTQDKIYFILGKDSLYNLHTWYKGFELLDKSSLICLDREDDHFNKIDKNQDTVNFIDKHKVIVNKTFDLESLDLNKIIFIKQECINISSSLIRETLNTYYKDKDKASFNALKTYLDLNVLNYILENELYKNNSN